MSERGLEYPFSLTPGFCFGLGQFQVPGSRGPFFTKFRMVGQFFCWNPGFYVTHGATGHGSEIHGRLNGYLPGVKSDAC